MAKIFVTDSSGGNPVPFLRGILTRSLSDAGLAFDQAYEVASEIRNRLGDSARVTNDELRQEWMSTAVPLADELRLKVPAHFDEQRNEYVLEFCAGHDVFVPF